MKRLQLHDAHGIISVTPIRAVTEQLGRRPFLSLLLVIVLIAAPAQADQTAIILHKLLVAYGYQDVGPVVSQTGTISRLYASRGAVMGIDLDPQGRFASTTLLVYDARDASVYYGLGAGYLAVQASLGKIQNYLDDPKALARKGLYLLDAVTHNLQRLDKTRFAFDDMTVTAAKDETDRVVVIVLAPRWRL